MKYFMVDHSHTTLAKGAGIVFMGTIIGRLLGYLTRLIVARYFEPADYGLLTLALSVFSIASIIGLMGLNGSLFRFIPEFVAKGHERKIRPAVYYTMKISVPISFVVSIFIFLFSDLISNEIFHTTNLSPILKIMSVAIPVSVALSIIIGAIMGLKFVKYRTYLDDIIKPSSRILSILVFIVFGFGLEWIAFAYNISFFIPLVIGFFILFKITQPGKNLDRSDKKDIFSYSWPTMFTSIIFIIMGQIDSIILGIFRTPIDVGIYNAALPTVDIMVVVYVAIISVFLPLLSELHIKGELNLVEGLYKRVIKWLLMFTFPIFIVFVVFPSQILDLLFGDSYISGALALSILSVGYLVNVVLYSSNDILNLFKKPKLQLYASIIAVLMNIVLDYLLIPTYGIVGAAIATAMAYSFLGSFVTILSFKISGFTPFSSKLLKVILSGIFTLIIFSGISFFVRIELLSFVLAALCIIVVYMGALLIFGAFDGDDIDTILAIERKMGIRIPFVRNFIKKIVRRNHFN